MDEQIADKRRRVARRLVDEMFQVQPGESVAITSDTGSDEAMVSAFFDAVVEAGGKPLVLHFNQARDNAQAGLPDWPAEALTGALSNVDVWIETNLAFMLYSDIFEAAMKNNERLRFTTITGSSLESLDRVFCGYDISTMGKLLSKIKTMAESANAIRVTTQKGTDVSYEMEPRNLVDFDDGDFSRPKFCTAPGYVNLVPKSGTMKGNIVFDMIMHVDLSKGGHVEFRMEKGKIVDFIGAESQVLKEYIEKFNEENMQKISHMMIGLCPGVRELSWEIVEDERIWGGVDFGFGHTSSIDMPPEGQPATSHFDGVMEKATIYFDDQMVLENGVVVHPELIADSKQLLS